MNGPDPAGAPLDEAALYADLARRVRLTPAIAPGADLCAWTPDGLRGAHLPPRRAAPFHPAWEEALAPIELVPPKPVQDFFAIDRSGRHSGAAKTVTGSSQNWSGAVLGIPDGWSCHAVQAQWCIPAARPGVPDTVPDTAPGACWQGSCWIGLDGDLPGSITLPQLGSTHYARRVGGAVVSTAELWWQWWIANDRNNAPVRIPVPVKPQDRVLARLTVLSPILVHFFVKNLTTNLAASFDVLAPSLPGTPPVPIEHQTVEWIVERQRVIGGIDLLPFADYGTCRFERCAAAMLGPAGEPIGMDLASPLTLQIQDWADPAQHGAIISGYAGGDADTIEVSYQS